ncbi:MAG: hypothetical protein ACO3JL_10175 [Myxococcota bacterium]
MLTLTLLLALQTPPADPAATPPAAAETASSEEAPMPSVPAADPAVEPEGWSPLAVGGVQLASGAGACCVGACLTLPLSIGFAFVPVVGPFLATAAGAVIEGALIGGVDTWVGDRFGRQRAAMIWPMLAASGSLLVGGLAANFFALATTGSAGSQFTLTNTNGLSVNLNNLNDADPVVTTAISYAGLAAALVLPVVVYALTATDKGPGDEGQGLPGILSPAEPMPEASPSVALQTHVAMHY